MRNGIVWLAFAAAALLVGLAALSGWRGLSPGGPERPPAPHAVASLAEPPVPAQPASAKAAAALAPASPVLPSFDIVTVDPQGHVVVAGRARAGDHVRVLADGKPIGEAIADANGEWVLLPPTPIAPGDRVLTLEARGPEGGPVRLSRDKVALSVVPGGADAEKRSAVAVLLPGDAGAPPRILQEAPPDQPEASVTAAATGAGTWVVKRGNSLWLIARQTYGVGERYSAIYDANRARIRNPDLIYPGQQFALPKQ